MTGRKIRAIMYINQVGLEEWAPMRRYQVFVGNFGSGKTELALEFAHRWTEQEEPVTLISSTPTFARRNGGKAWKTWASD